MAESQQIEATTLATIEDLDGGPVATSLPVVITGRDADTGLYVGEYRPTQPGSGSQLPTVLLSRLVGADLPGIVDAPPTPTPSPTPGEPTDPPGESSN